MKSSSETRLQKLEPFHGSRDKRLFVIRGDTEEKRDAYVADLISSGKAAPTDSFVYTGIDYHPLTDGVLPPGDEGGFPDCGTIPDLMDRIAKHGRKVHEPRD